MELLRRLYRGETNTQFIAYRKRWYLASGVLILLCLASFAFRGFHMGVEFAGGNQFIVPAQSGTTLEDVRGEVEGRGITVASAQTVGKTGGNPSYVIRTPKLNDDQREEAIDAIVDAANVSEDKIAATEVSNTWGRQVTTRALQGLGVFLIVVAVFLWLWFERSMAIAALGALVHDLLLTAGVYSMSGFEVTPATVVGLLTILGFSLYDTVVVFDKVQENTKGLLGSSRYTYAEAANLAVNQTLMRSINTSLIALLPVGALLFVGAGVLGVGTLKDLALVLFVGLATGAYSSMFLATPWLVELKMTDQKYKLHAQRVLARRTGDKAEGRRGKAARDARAARDAGDEKDDAGDEKKAVPAKTAGARTKLGKTAVLDVDEVEESDEIDETAETADVEDADETAEPAKPRQRGALAGSAPRAGARPAGSRNAPRKRQGKRR